MKINKTFTIFSFLFIISIIYLQSQNFVIPGKRWDITHIGTIGEKVSGCSMEQITNMPVIINDTAYYIFHYLDNYPLFPNNKGYIREDNQGKVYFREHSDSTEFVLFDFGLKVGDSLKVLNIEYFYVNSINKTNTDSYIFYLQSKSNLEYDSYTFDSKIGRCGLLSDPFIVLVGGYDDLVCCSINDSVIYQNINYSDCDCYSRITKVKDDSYGEIKISPNLVKTTVTIDIPLVKNNVLISMLNVSGVIVYTAEINQNQLVINTSNFVEGIYFIKIESEEFNECRKIIIEH